MPEMLSKKPNVRHLAHHARRAIAVRLGQPAPDALLSVERDGASVVLRLNSGGNARAVEAYLRQRGYRAEQAGGNPVGYGCAVRVTRISAPEREEGRAA